MHMLLIPIYAGLHAGLLPVSAGRGATYLVPLSHSITHNIDNNINCTALPGTPIARYNNPLSLWVWTSILGVVATAIGTAINLIAGH